MMFSDLDMMFLDILHAAMQCFRRQLLPAAVFIVASA